MSLKILSQYLVFEIEVEKTVSKVIGSLKHADYNGKANICCEGPIRTLGITFSNDPKVILEENFMSKLGSIDKIMTMWSIWGLSLKGMVTILKSLIIPKLLCPMSVLPVSVNVVAIMDK